MKTVAIHARNASEALAQVHERLGPNAVVLEVRKSGWLRKFGGCGSVELLAGLPDEESQGQIPQDFPLQEWGGPQSSASELPHVFVGPPGSGKSTLLCKWLVRQALCRTTRIRVYRLDGWAANTSQLVDLHCETAGIAVQRIAGEPVDAGDPTFVDLPGFDPTMPRQHKAFEAALLPLGPVRLHLVLNGAYERAVLLRQARAFRSCLSIEDVSFTHLDESEDPRRIIEIGLGINCSVRFLSGGQNIPGRLQEFSPESAHAAWNQ